MKNSVRYIGTQGLFWMLYCVTNGYAIYYLSELGYSTMVIGVMTTIFCAIAALAGPVAGRIADRTEGGWKRMLCILIIISAVADVLLVFPLPAPLKALLFGVGNICASCIMPLVNQISFYYSSRGETIDFGKARGMGSFAYAVCSMALGQLTLITGSVVIAIGGLLISLIMLYMILRFPIGQKLPEGEALSGTAHTETDNKGSIPDFIKKHKYFLLVWMAINLIMVMHMMTNNYMLYICTQAGGDSSTMGTALAIAAVAEIPIMLIFNKLIKKFSSVGLLVFAAAFFCLKCILYIVGTSAGSIAVIYLAQVFQMLSFAVYANASVYFSDEQMDEKDKSLGQSIMSCTMIIGQVVGNLLGGSLIDSYDALHMCLTGLVICIAGSVLMVICWLAGRKKRLQ